MDKNDVMGFVRKAMPWIGAAATGGVPVLVAMAAQSVGEAVGMKVEPTPSAISAAVAAATPEQIMAMKVADNDLAIKLKELEYKDHTELYASEVTDRNGARDREIKVADNTNRILALLIVLAWCLIQAFLLTHVVEATMKELVARVLGTLDAALTMVLAYYFGSSRGSDRKTELMGSNK